MKSRRRTASPKSWANADNDCNEGDYSTDLPSGEMGSRSFCVAAVLQDRMSEEGQTRPFGGTGRATAFAP